jgi:hypothetical protein
MSKGKSVGRQGFISQVDISRKVRLGEMKTKTESAALIGQYGEMWPRNTENINSVPSKKAGGQGVYILYDGSMTLYIGKGNIKSRLRAHRHSKRLGQMWDHFSWYVLKEPAHMHDMEALLLRMLPFYLRSLTRQRGQFSDKIRQNYKDGDPDFITRKLPRRKSSSRRRPK